MEKQRLSLIGRRFLYNSIVTVGALSVATIISFYFHGVIYRSLNIALLYILAILVIGLLSSDYICGGVAALTSVILINYWFTYPFSKLDFSLSGYPMTFLVMLTLSLSISTIMIHLKEKTRILKEQEGQLIEAEKEKMRANLLRSVSHDIRTPLTSIVGATSTILETPTLSPAEQRDLLADVRDDAQWLIQVVENLLSITRIGSDPACIHKEAEPAEELLGVAVQKFRKRYPAVSVEVCAPEALLFVPMDAILIGQVLSNLLENAVLHGKTTTKIDLSVQSDHGDALFSVRDNGQGIAPELLPTLFDGTLKHGETTACDGKRNMGLGLSVCLAIVRAHGGTMEAQNLADGAEFTFRLPLSTGGNT